MRLRMSVGKTKCAVGAMKCRGRVNPCGRKKRLGRCHIGRSRPKKRKRLRGFKLRHSMITVTAEVRHNLFLVVKEAINNAVKHTTARQIKFGMYYTANRLTVEVADDGQGFRVDETSAAGNGLENMRKRMSAIGGEFELDSKLGRGTTVKFSLVLKEGSMVAQ